MMCWVRFSGAGGWLASARKKRGPPRAFPRGIRTTLVSSRDGEGHG